MSRSTTPFVSTLITEKFSDCSESGLCQNMTIVFSSSSVERRHIPRTVQVDWFQFMFVHRDTGML